MQLKDYPVDDGMKVWLTHDEVDQFLEQADDTEQRIAFALGVRCGLRVAEICAVSPPDVVQTPAGQRVRVWSGKGDKYRETPVPPDVLATMEAYADVREEGPNTPLVDKSTRTVSRWVERAADNCRANSDEDAWRYLGPHDLRRTWGTLLVEAGVEPGMIMEWGGWEDWETFREHYLGAYTAQMQRSEVEKVPWL